MGPAAGNHAASGRAVVSAARADGDDAEEFVRAAGTVLSRYGHNLDTTRVRVQRVPQYVSGFQLALIELMMLADGPNRARIGRGFPAIVAAVTIYQREGADALWPRLEAVMAGAEQPPAAEAPVPAADALGELMRTDDNRTMAVDALRAHAGVVHLIQHPSAAAMRELADLIEETP